MVWPHLTSGVHFLQMQKRFPAPGKVPLDFECSAKKKYTKPNAHNNFFLLLLSKKVEQLNKQWAKVLGKVFHSLKTSISRKNIPRPLLFAVIYFSKKLFVASSMLYYHAKLSHAIFFEYREGKKILLPHRKLYFQFWKSNWFSIQWSAFQPDSSENVNPMVVLLEWVVFKGSFTIYEEHFQFNKSGCIMFSCDVIQELQYFTPQGL